MKDTVWQWTPYMIPLLIGIVFSIISALTVHWKRPQDAQSRIGALVLLAGAEWMAGYVMELGSVNLSAKVFWAQMQYIGIVLLPVSWFIFAVLFAGQRRYLTCRNLVLINLVPFATLLLVFTNNSHNLMWSQVTLYYSGSLVLMHQKFNWGFWLFWGYAILLAMGGVAHVSARFIRARHFYRRHSTMLMAVGTIMGATVAFDALGISPVPYLDLEPFAFVAVALLVTWGVFRLRWGDIVPVAYQSIIQRMNDPVIVLDHQKRILEMNHIAQDLFDLAILNVAGKRWIDLCPEYASLAERDTGQGEQAYSDEITLTKQDQRLTYEVRTSSLSDGYIVPVGQVIVLRDITDRKNNERELERRQRYLRAILNAAPDAIVALDKGGGIVEWNPGAEKLYGYTLQEALQQDLDSLIVDPDRIQEAREFSSLVIGGKTLPPVETTRRRKDGSAVTVILAAAPIIIDHTYSGAVVVYTDITHRKTSEDALRRLNLTLESRIEERTAELARTNAQLVQEAADRTQVEAKLVQRNRALLSLQSSILATASSLDLRFILDTVTWEMIDLFDVKDCVVFEWHPENSSIEVVAQYDLGITALEPGTDLDLTTYPSWRQTLIERSHRQASLEQPDIEPSERAYLSARSKRVLLIVPMVFQDRVIGLIEITDDQVGRKFTDQEISLVQLLANQAAIAIENARLYERAQQEIADRTKVEQQIKASLDEKVVLLKEIHHRVKNNLQVISSLLSLQSRQTQDRQALELLHDSQNRVRSMALIHEKLYRSDDLSRIDFAEYIHSLASFLVRSYRAHVGPVTLDIDGQDVFLPIDAAVPCGLIVNELITNSLKYAFPDDQAGEIYVTLRADNPPNVTLTIGDTGVGFPQELEFTQTGSLGLQLVHSLVEQIEGSIELKRERGTEFIITFRSVSE